MSIGLEAKIWTYELTNGTISIDESDGVRSITVFNGSTINGTVTGSTTITVGGLSSSSITLTEGMTYNVAGAEATVLKEFTITAPLGCTLKITAEV